MSSSAQATVHTAVRRNISAIWIAVVLWIASNALVSTISKFATWEGNASYTKLSDFCRIDCTWYDSVLQHGYDLLPQRENGMSSWPFHPLFPATAYPLWRWFKLPAPASLVVMAKLELLLATYAFLLLLSDRLETRADYFRAGSLVAFNPYVIYAHAGYAEPLYFALIALAFYFADKRRWILSGATGGLASATRVIGFLFSLSYAFQWGRELRTRSFWRNLDLDRVIGLLLCPLGMALFMLYMYHHLGDALAAEHAHVAWGKVVGNPFHTLSMCLVGHHWPRIWGAMIMAAFVLSGWLIKLRKPELAIFLFVSVFLAMTADYWSLARYIWWQPPFLYAIYCVLKRHTGLWLIYTAFASSMISFMVVQWFHEHVFLI